MEDCLTRPGAPREQFRSALRELFQIADDQLLNEFGNDLALVQLQPGDPLVIQGAPSDHLLLVLSGRLRAVRRHGEQVEVLGEIVRGETVGEVGMITGASRSATVVAVRDSLVAQIPRARFEQILSRHPEIAMALMRTVVHRARNAEKPPNGRSECVTLCLVPVTDGLDLEPLARRLVAAIEELGSDVQLLTGREFSEFPCRDREDRNPDGAVAHWLDKAEADTTVLVLLTDPRPTAWTTICVQRADEILLVADASAPAQICATEARFFKKEQSLIRPKQTLVLLHDPEKRAPTGTAAWLDRRPVERHLHIRPALAQDVRRLARLVTGRGVGIVLSGGGARGFAHVGVLNALAEARIEIDVIGGTSIGAAIGGLRAMDLTGEALTRAARRIFVESGNPTSDYNLLPLVSLIKGHRTRRITEQAILDVAGRDIGLEDSWTTYFCVAGNYSTATEAVLTRGSFSKALLASFAIPGALPPVIIDGHLFVDGGTVNNMPLDVLEGYGVSKRLAVDLLSDQVRKVEMDWVPGTWALLLDRLRPRAKRRYDLPALPELLLKASVLQSVRRQREMRARADICFRPRLRLVGLLDWHRFDEVVQDGYESASKDLAIMGPSLSESWSAPLQPDRPTAND
jgi:NTE family protein